MRSDRQFLVAAALALVLGLTLGRAAVGSLPRLPATTPDGSPSTVALTGRLGPAVEIPSALSDGRVTAAVAVVLRADDWLSCEDLGRQLRALRREVVARGLPLVVWTDAESLQVNRVFLRRERLRDVPIHALRDLAIVDRQADVATPAAVLFRSDGAILSGVSHPRRSRNVRIVSFVQELDWSRVPE